MIVCICRGVSDRQVRLTVLNGATTVKQVGAMCQAGRGCGACHEQIQGMIAEATCPANDTAAACVSAAPPVATATTAG